jgi:predicted transcriptional regulator
MEKDVFVEKVSALQKQIRELKYEIDDLADQYIAESEYVKEFPIGSIAKVVDNDSGTFVTLGFIEKYEVTSNYNLRPVILKIKKDGTVSKHHYYFSMFQDRLEKYEK